MLVVDDSQVFLDAACAWIGTRPSLHLVGTARNGAEAIEAIDRHAPDLVLMDAFMKGVDGFEATRRIKSAPGAPLVVILSVHEGTAMAHEARSAGADAFIPKSEFASRLMTVIDEIRTAGTRRTPIPARHEAPPPRDVAERTVAGPLTRARLWLSARWASLGGLRRVARTQVAIDRRAGGRPVPSLDQGR